MRHNLFDYFAAQCSKVSLVTRALVCEDNLAEIRGLTAFEQHPRINLGDVITVFFFHNRALKQSGTVTIWHGKNLAEITTRATCISGEWLESEKLVVSEQRDDAWTLKGELVTGRLAMDICGIQGIYSCGNFYRQSQEMFAASV